MRRFKKILFSPLGSHENPAAVRRVTKLAAENDASLSLLGVLDAPSGLQRLVRRSRVQEQALAAEPRSLLDARPNLPARFVECVETALARDPRRRYATAGKFSKALANAAARPPSRADGPARLARRYWPR